MKIIIILTLFLFSSSSQASKYSYIENTIWGFNNGYVSYLLILKKEGIANISHTSDNGPTRSSRKGSYTIKNKLLTISFPESEENKSPAFQKELTVTINPKEHPYLAGTESYKLSYLSKYPSEGVLTIPITN